MTRKPHRRGLVPSRAGLVPSRDSSCGAPCVIGATASGNLVSLYLTQQKDEYWGPDHKIVAEWCFAIEPPTEYELVYLGAVVPQSAIPAPVKLVGPDHDGWDRFVYPTAEYMAMLNSGFMIAGTARDLFNIRSDLYVADLDTLSTRPHLVPSYNFIINELGITDPHAMSYQITLDAPLMADPFADRLSDLSDWDLLVEAGKLGRNPTPPYNGSWFYQKGRFAFGFAEHFYDESGPRSATLDSSAATVFTPTISLRGAGVLTRDDVCSGGHPTYSSYNLSSYSSYGTSHSAWGAACAMADAQLTPLHGGGIIEDDYVLSSFMPGVWRPRDVSMSTTLLSGSPYARSGLSAAAIQKCLDSLDVGTTTMRATQWGARGYWADLGSLRPERKVKTSIVFKAISQGDHIGDSLMDLEAEYDPVEDEVRITGGVHLSNNAQLYSWYSNWWSGYRKTDIGVAVGISTRVDGLLVEPALLAQLSDFDPDLVVQDNQGNTIVLDIDKIVEIAIDWLDGREAYPDAVQDVSPAVKHPNTGERMSTGVNLHFNLSQI